MNEGALTWPNRPCQCTFIHFTRAFIAGSSVGHQTCNNSNCVRRFPWRILVNCRLTLVTLEYGGGVGGGVAELVSEWVVHCWQEWFVSVVSDLSCRFKVERRHCVRLLQRLDYTSVLSIIMHKVGRFFTVMILQYFAVLFWCRHHFNCVHLVLLLLGHITGLCRCALLLQTE